MVVNIIRGLWSQYVADSNFEKLSSLVLHRDSAAISIKMNESLNTLENMNQQR